MSTEAKTAFMYKRYRSLSQRHQNKTQNLHYSLNKLQITPLKDNKQIKYQTILKNAKIHYYQTQNIQKALHLFQLYLKYYPNHAQSLYLSAVGYLQMNQYQNAIKKLNKLRKRQEEVQQIQSPKLSASNLKKKKLNIVNAVTFENMPNAMLLLSLAYSKINLLSKSFETIAQCIQMFPKFEQAYCFRGKLYVKSGEIIKASQDFNKILILNNKSWLAYIGLGDCMKSSNKIQQALNMYEHALKILEKLENQEESDSICETLLKYSVCLYHLEKYNKAIKHLESIAKQFKKPTSQTYYFLAECQLKLKFIDEAILNFQYCIRAQSNKKVMANGLCSLLKHFISNFQFYEASDAIILGKNFKIICENLQKLVEGCVYIMKKKYQHGIQILMVLKQKLLIQEKQKGIMPKKQDKIKFRRHKRANTMTIDSEKLQSEQQFILPILLQFSAYSHFFLDNFTKSIENYQQFQQFQRNVYGKDPQQTSYNKLLSEGLLMLDNDMYEDSIQKFTEAYENYYKRQNRISIESFIYRSIALIRLAYGDYPTYGKFSGKQQILKCAAQYLQQVTVLMQTTNISQHYLLYYIKGLVNLVLQKYQQARDNIHKSLAICEDCTWKILYAKGVTQIQVKNYQAAVKEFTAGLILAETPQLYLGRCISYLLENHKHENTELLQNSFEDLQKFIQLQNSQEYISIWVSKILFYNNAYEQANKSIQKIGSYDEDVVMMSQCLKIFEGQFSQGGIEGQAIVDAFLGTLGQQVLQENQQSFSNLGYLYPSYLIWLRILNLYARQKYQDLIKFLQKAIFQVSKSSDQVQLRYNIAIVYMLLGQQVKAQKVLNCLTGFSSVNLSYRVSKMVNLNFSNQQCIEDLSQQFSCKRLSVYLPYREAYVKLKNQTEIKIYVKISVPFPIFPKSQISLNLSDNFILNQIHYSTVQKRIDAPWIRKNKNIFQFTNKITQSDTQVVQDETSSISQLQKQIYAISDNSNQFEEESQYYQL